MSELIQKFPRDIDILVDRLLHEEELKGKEKAEIVNHWDDHGAYIFGFCQDIELVTMYPQYSLIDGNHADLFKDVPSEKIYRRLAIAVEASMNDETILISRV